MKKLVFLCTLVLTVNVNSQETNKFKKDEVNMNNSPLKEVKFSFIETNGIRMRLAQMGTEGPLVLLVHGWPESWYSWRHQLTALSAEGFRVIAPDMRGYGGTDVPPNISDYTIQKLIGDLTGLMDALSINKPVIIGHDWGALIAWQMSLIVPKRISGLIALNIPFFKRPPINPITIMRWKLGKDFYIVNFQDSDQADRHFNENPSHFINSIMRKRQRNTKEPKKKSGKKNPISLIRMLEQEQPAGEPVLNAEELAYYTRAFTKNGFTGPINWYRNFKHNWKSTRNIKQIVQSPTLFVGATDEIVVSVKQIEHMKPYVEDLEITMIEDCGHWTQQEKPDELNAILLDWLKRRYPSIRS